MRSMISRKLFAGLTVAGLLAAPLFAVAGPIATANRPYLGMAAFGGIVQSGPLL